MWTEAYLKGAASDANRRTALVELTGVCGTYVGIDSDRRLLVVLLDAERRGYERPLLRKVLETYKCLPNLPSSADRARLIGALEARCP